MASPDNNSEYKTKANSQQIKRKRSRRELDTLNDDNSSRARRDLPKCPICEYRIEPQYWQEHYQYELGRLSETTSEAYTDPLNKNKGKRGAAVAAKRQLEQAKGKKKISSVYEETLEKIQKNRVKRSERLQQMNNTGISHEQDRNDSEVALQVMLDDVDVQTCFICNERLYGDLEAVNLHIDNCLSQPATDNQCRTNEDDDEEEDIEDDIGDDEISTNQPQQSNGWEEYEWAGQVRVRATAMMEGGYGGAGFATSSKKDEDDDEELDVEDDDAAQFGQSQYTERDIVVNMDDDTEDASALREMVSGGAMRTPTSESDERQGFEETVSDIGWSKHLNTKSLTNLDGGGHSKLVIDSLKSRIHQLENASKSVPRCLICLESYKTPLTSIICWHVHCEQCWLQTLGSKKLCPQCQKITTPADLRRIYL